MELHEALQSRRAVREYTDQTIDRHIIEKLIAAAVLAPSAENHQPWRFAVCLDRERIDEWAQRVKHWLLGHSDAIQFDPAIKHMLFNPQFSIFYHAPALVMVCAQSANAQAQQDCCLAAQNLLLAARDANLGTCWIGLSRPWLDLPETKAELGVPKDYSVVAPIVLGHPQRWPDSHPRQPPMIHWLR